MLIRYIVQFVSCINNSCCSLNSEASQNCLVSEEFSWDPQTQGGNCSLFYKRAINVWVHSKLNSFLIYTNLSYNWFLASWAFRGVMIAIYIVTLATRAIAIKVISVFQFFLSVTLRIHQINVANADGVPFKFWQLLRKLNS